MGPKTTLVHLLRKKKLRKNITNLSLTYLQAFRMKLTCDQYHVQLIMTLKSLTTFAYKLTTISDYEICRTKHYATKFMMQTAMKMQDFLEIIKSFSLKTIFENRVIQRLGPTFSKTFMNKMHDWIWVFYINFFACLTRWE